jgi:hypothetical protein
MRQSDRPKGAAEGSFKMSAIIYYMRDHHRLRDRAGPGSPALRGANPQRVRISDSRSGLGFLAGMLVYVIALVMIGVWLTTEIAAVGRPNSGCLSNVLRTCGAFPSEHAGGGGSNLIY